MATGLESLGINIPQDNAQDIGLHGSFRDLFQDMVHSESAGDTPADFRTLNPNPDTAGYKVSYNQPDNMTYVSIYENQGNADSRIAGGFTGLVIGYDGKVPEAEAIQRAKTDLATPPPPVNDPTIVVG